MFEPARPRRKARARFGQPSASWYIGYVEDDESVEMIEKKFQALEEYAKQLQNDIESETPPENSVKPSENKENNFFSEQQLEDVFKITSSFSVKGALSESQNEITYDFDESFDLKQELSDYENDKSPMRIDTSEDEWCTVVSSTGKKRKRSNPVKKSHSQPCASYELTGADGSLFTVKKKAKVFDPTVPQYTRLPDPIPSSWAVHVKPFTRLVSLEERTLALQQENKHFYQITCDNILQYPLTKLPRHPDGYVAILMNPPWALPSEATSDGLLITPKDFAALKITDKIIPCGFIFIWVEKENIPAIFKQMAKWNFIYVENLVWVKKYANNNIVAESSQFFKRSKATLFIFRKNSSSHIELKHQRNPDVHYDFLRRTENGREDKPDVAYNLIETLLPEAVHNSPCRLLELWAKPGSIRSGWTLVSEE